MLKTYTLDEASVQFFKGATTRYLSGLIKKGELKAKKVGHKWVVSETAIADFFNSDDNDGGNNAATNLRSDLCQSSNVAKSSTVTLPHKMEGELSDRLKLVIKGKHRKHTTG